MLEDAIDSFITEIIDEQKHNVDQLQTQQYGAPPHYVAAINEF